MIMFRPDPKKPRIKLNPKDYHELRVRVCERAVCRCEECNGWTPLEAGHFHHIKSRGAGGDDSENNGQWLCWRCHAKKG
jgi:5-methylcytosine-specific restriction endonuclease McrA